MIRLAPLPLNLDIIVAAHAIVRTPQDPTLPTRLFTFLSIPTDPHHAQSSQ
ncbi:MAG: hypothetical protein AABZ17_08245 [Nitrospirota bacterium]